MQWFLLSVREENEAELKQFEANDELRAKNEESLRSHWKILITRRPLVLINLD